MSLQTEQNLGSPGDNPLGLEDLWWGGEGLGEVTADQSQRGERKKRVEAVLPMGHQW